MFAIFKTGGKQLKASIGDRLYIEKIDAEDGDTYVFSEVLMIDGKIGTPLLSGAGVKATVIKNGKDKKLKVVRYHPKKNVNKVYGHRQPYTLVEVTEIVETGVTKDGVIKKASKKAIATINDKDTNEKVSVSKTVVDKKISPPSDEKIKAIKETTTAEKQINTQNKPETNDNN